MDIKQDWKKLFKLGVQIKNNWENPLKTNIIHNFVEDSQQTSQEIFYTLKGKINFF